MKLANIGRNAWRIDRATHASVLVDGCNYFTQLERALKAAEKSILILGWDFDGIIKLCPDHEECPPLGEFLHSLVEAKPQLKIFILIWSGAIVHAPGASMPLLVGADWQEHDRIVVKLDQNHPLYASHHQKIVVIDDSLAFVGGMDLTIERWDTCSHTETNSFRLGPTGKPYHPVHDAQMVVAGPAAAALGELARERWRAATGQKLDAPPCRSLWLDKLAPDFSNVSIAIARTAPAQNGSPAVQEIAQLTTDIISNAQDYIYIETQYLTASNVRRALIRSLDRVRGPEVVVVVNRELPGLFERIYMNRNRNRLVRRLRRADTHNRLRVFYPFVAGKTRSCDIKIHSKVMISDDSILRVGSANLNNRSMGLDSECDVFIEASNSHEERTIATIRDRLISEHLGVQPEIFATTLREKKSFIRAIEKCGSEGRGLRPFPETNLEGPTEPVVGTSIVDPESNVSY